MSSKVQMKPRVPLEPRLGARMAASAVVVRDQMQIESSRRFPINLRQERMSS